MTSRIAMYARFISGMPGFLREKVTPESARQTIRNRLASREKNLIWILDKAVFSRPESPYNFLFQAAGCDAEEVRRLIRNDGVDTALSVLYDAGVNASFDEMKGRAPIVRGGRTFEGNAESFDNPLTENHYESRTSGTTGKATSVKAGLAHVHSNGAAQLLGQEANGTMGAPTMLYRPGMPATTATNTILRHIQIDNPIRRWFSPVPESDGSYPIRFRLAALITPHLVRAFGAPYPPMEVVPFSEAATVARAARDFAQSEGRCYVRCSVSAALSVSIAAIEKGIDLTGVTFTGAGEPASPGKVKGIATSGARYVTSYAMTEAGPLGIACPRGLDATDVHFLSDKAAMLQRMTPSKFGEPVGMLYLTTLLPTAPKILINVATDDFGILEERRCGCIIDDVGLHQHLRQIKSAGKLTGRGITLVASDILHIIEDILPARFGGTPQDYQLVEEEDKSGLTHLHLLVSPDVKLADEDAPAQVLLEGLNRGTPGATLQSAVLRSANAVRVRREKPRPSARGKLPAFKTVGFQ